MLFSLRTRRIIGGAKLPEVLWLLVVVVVVVVVHMLLPPVANRQLADSVRLSSRNLNPLLFSLSSQTPVECPSHAYFSER
jgi:hypothetical protein